MRIKRIIRKISRALLALAVGLPLAAAAAPGQLPEPALDMGHPRVQEVIEVQSEVTDELMAIEGILGTAVGLDDNGQASLHVYVNLEDGNAGEIIRALPRDIRRVVVRGVLTEPFRALKGPPGGGGRGGGGGGGVSHTAIQTSPIQLGTSGGWRHDLANGYCCGGTLGALIQVGGQKRILSNYHVFEADIVNGGNGMTAQTGNFIIQPGLIDVACNANSAQNVASLVKTGSLPGSNVDASSATIISGMVDESGSILEIGTISSSTVAASINQAVKKSGRTTGLTRSKVSGLNATVSVAYDNECAGGAAFTKTFTGQVIIANRGSKFIAGGDSGSLMVEDVDSNPRAVGLLFAGSSTIAVANPIDDVLDFFDATMVGVGN
jgi:hypothetical protein